MNKWYSGEGKNSDVVVGATVRLAREFGRRPSHSYEQRDPQKHGEENLCRREEFSLCREFDLVDLSAVSSAQAYAYAEQQLISRRFARQKDQSAFCSARTAAPA